LDFQVWAAVTIPCTPGREKTRPLERPGVNKAQNKERARGVHGRVSKQFTESTQAFCAAANDLPGARKNLPRWPDCVRASTRAVPADLIGYSEHSSC
jgi:hypothetical protein